MTFKSKLWNLETIFFKKYRLIGLYEIKESIYTDIDRKLKEQSYITNSRDAETFDNIDQKLVKYLHKTDFKGEFFNLIKATAYSQ